MAPEHIKGTNFIKLFQGEQLTGRGGTIKGPTLLRVEMLSEWLDIQGQGRHVYIPGNSYEDVLRATTKESKT